MVLGDLDTALAPGWPRAPRTSASTSASASATVLLADGCRFDLVRARAERYAATGGAAGRAARHARGGPAPPRRHGQRDGARRSTARLHAVPARARGPRRGPAAGPARRELRRRPDAPVACRPLRRAARLRRRGAHARPGRRRRPVDRERRPARGRAAPGAQRARSVRGAAGGRWSSTHGCCRRRSRSREARHGGARAAAARGPAPTSSSWPRARPAWTCRAALVAGRDGVHGGRARRRGGRLARGDGGPAAGGTHERGDRPRGPRRARRGRRGGRRRQRAPLARGPAPRAPGDHRRDLLAAGIPQGPELGERLRRALDAKLDGEPPDREAELARPSEADRCRSRAG